MGPFQNAGLDQTTALNTHQAACAQQQAHNFLMQQINGYSISADTPMRAEIVNLRGTSGILRTFHGRQGEDVNKWLEEYKFWIQENKFPKGSFARYLQFALRGPAYKWWITTGVGLGQTKGPLKRSLRSHFDNEDAKRYWAKQFDTICQLPGECLQEYIYRFNTMQQRGYPNLVDEQKAVKFADTLNRDFKTYVLTLQEINPRLSFTDMLAKCLKYEARTALNGSYDPSLLFPTPYVPSGYPSAGQSQPTAVSPTPLPGGNTPMASSGRTMQFPNATPIPFPMSPTSDTQYASTPPPATPLSANRNVPKMSGETQPVLYVEAKNFEDSLQSLKNQMNRIKRAQKKCNFRDYKGESNQSGSD
jgi:hypothetical protein